MIIALHRGKSLVGRLIRWQSRGPYSHAAIVLHDGEVYESREFIGVHSLPHTPVVKGERVDFYEVFTTPVQDDIIVSFLKSQLGKQYDYLAIARFITREAMPHWDKKKWFCSELVFYAFQQAGINLLDRIEPWAVSPNQLSTSPLLRGISKHSKF